MITDDVLQFWFAGMDANGNVPAVQMQKWSAILGETN